MGRLDAHDLAWVDVDFWRSVGPVVGLWREQLLHVATLAELHIKHASFLVNLDDRGARIVGNNSSRGISIHSVLLEQLHVSRILFRQFDLVADCDVRVNHSIFSANMLQAVRIVSLIYPIKVELAGFSLCILILHAIFFEITIKGSLTLDSSILLTRDMKDTLTSISQGIHLQFFTLTNIVSETISLTVDLTIGFSVV